MGLSLAEMEKRLVRYEDLIPCTTAFIDTRTPGSDKKENFTIIGPGVAESPGQHVHIKIPHGFNIGGARQPKGCVNSQHSHESEEVFMVHTGSWAFRWGHDGSDGEVVLNAGDTISIPLHVFRGFECVSDEESFLFAILGGDDPGFVTWAPYVFEQAKGHGLVLTKSGLLVDTAAGEKVPDDDEPCNPTSEADLASFRTMNLEEMSACVVTANEAVAQGLTLLSEASEGVQETPIIGPANPVENIAAGKISNPHGFHFRRLTFSPGGRIPTHSRAEEEVLFVQSGQVGVFWNGEGLTLNAGDTITIPKDHERRFWAPAGKAADVYVVRGGDAPAAPIWLQESDAA